MTLQGDMAEDTTNRRAYHIMFENGYENNLGETVKNIVFVYWTKHFNFEFKIVNIF